MINPRPQRVLQNQPKYVVLTTGEFEEGLHYVKIVQSSQPERQILDIMFKRGLRLTVDLKVGEPIKDICPTLVGELMACRPGQAEEVKPVIEAIGSCISRAISDEFGLIQSYNFNDESNKIQRSWEQQMFLLFIRGNMQTFKVPYEVAVWALEEHYENAEFLNDGITIP